MRINLKLKSFLLFSIGSFTTAFLPHVCQSQPLTGSWTTSSSLGFTARLGLSSNVINGMIYVVGGNSGNGNILNTLEVFDPSSDTWNTPVTTGTINVRAFHTASVVNGKIYLIGGVTGKGSNTNLISDVDMFDPIAGSWTTLGTSGNFTNRWGHSAAAIGNKIYVFGGDTLNLTASPHPTKTVQVLDLSTNNWSVLPTNGNFVIPFFATCNVISGKIYFTGGTDSTGVNSLNTLEVFDPSTDRWSMPNTFGTFTARSAHASAVIDNEIFVMGGYGTSSDLPSAQIFDPSSDTWYTPVTHGEFTARDELCVSVVGDKIYAMGGENDALIPLNVNEVFSPSGDFVTQISTADSISVFPNPVRSVMIVKSNKSTWSNLSIINTLGSEVLNLRNPSEVTSERSIDLSMLPPGTYLMIFSSPKSVITKRIIHFK